MKKHFIFPNILFSKAATALIITVLIAFLCTGCLGGITSSIEQIQAENEEEDATLDVDEAGNEETPDSASSEYPYLNVEDGCFNATPREFLKAINLIMPDHPFADESLFAQCTRYKNEQGIMLGLQNNTAGSAIQVIAVSCAGSDADAITATIEMAGTLYRICNQNSTEEQVPLFLNAMSLEPLDTTAIRNGVSKKSSALTYNSGLFDSYFYVAISSSPDSSIKLQLDGLTSREAQPGVRPEQDPEEITETPPETIKESLAERTYSGLDVTITRAKGYVSDLGDEYITLSFVLTNNNPVATTFDKCVFYQSVQDGLLMERYYESENEKGDTAVEIQPGETYELSLRYRCNGFTGITFSMKEMFGSDDTICTINF